MSQAPNIGPTDPAVDALNLQPDSPPPSPPVLPAASRRRDRRKKWWLRRWVGFKKAACNLCKYFCNKGPKRAFVFFGLMLAGLLLLLGTVYKDEFLQMTPTYRDQAILVFNTSLVVGAVLIGILLCWKATQKLCFSLIALYVIGWLVLTVITFLWNFVFVPTGRRLNYGELLENRYTPWSAPAKDRTATEALPTPTPAKQAEATPAPVVVAEHSPLGLITHGRFDPVQGNIYTVICDPGEGRRIEIEFFQRVDRPGEKVQRLQKCTPAGYRDVPLAEAAAFFAKATKIEWRKIGDSPPSGTVRRELGVPHGGSNPPPKAQVVGEGGPDAIPLLPLPDDIHLPEGEVAPDPPMYEL